MTVDGHSHDQHESEDDLLKQGVVRQLDLSDLHPEDLQGGGALWTYDDRFAGKAPFAEGCPKVLIGGSAFGKGIFTDDNALQTQEPFRVVRLAFAYGIRAIDTSPFYHPSEISLGRILDALRPEFPRESYYLQTKVGRYGPTKADFDYSPKRVRSSIALSLQRLRTTYLDSVVMHDVEFVCQQVGSSQEAGFAAADVLLKQDVRKACGLAFEGRDSDDDCATLPSRSHGPGDEAVIQAVRTLFELKDAGVVRNVGIGGYSLPVLLRLSRLIASTAPFRPLDVIVSYCHHTLQSDLLGRYATLFAQEPKLARSQAFKSKGQQEELPKWIAPMIINASPFSMGLLTDAGPPSWHPASVELRRTCAEASQTLCERQSSLASIAAHFGLSNFSSSSDVEGDDTSPSSSAGQVRTIVGMNTVEQVHQAASTVRAVLSNKDREEQKEKERYVIELLESRNLRNWSWASP